MNKIARFEKVSFNQFAEGVKAAISKGMSDDAIRIMYDNLKMPKRGTKGSAGYDFFAPTGIRITPGETKLIPTGIRAIIEEGWFLAIFPRSGLGFKYRLQLDNTTGIIDSDYSGSLNEGHIFVKLTNDGRENKVVEVKAGDGFVQGIFIPFGITEDDEATEERNGGFGSTTK